MAYELRLLWHTNPDFYTIWAVFIGGGGGLQYIDWSVLDPSKLRGFAGECAKHLWRQHICFTWVVNLAAPLLASLWSLPGTEQRRKASARRWGRTSEPIFCLHSSIWNWKRLLITKNHPKTSQGFLNHKGFFFQFSRQKFTQTSAKFGRTRSWGCIFWPQFKSADSVLNFGAEDNSLARIVASSYDGAAN